MSIAGFASIAGGSLLLGAGVAGIIIGQPALPERPSQLRDFRTPGIAVAALGTAVLLTGVTLVILGRAAHRRNAP